jgi:tryptophan 2,3-dioxygenase
MGLLIVDSTDRPEGDERDGGGAEGGRAGSGDSRFLTYAGYLHLDELLSLQQRRAGEHDEMLFIIIHQVYELWFKELLHELDHLGDLLDRDDLPPALHTMKRILTVLKVMVAQIDILETITPREFLTFRDRLEAASGLESFQFRELEFALGVKRPGILERYPVGSEPRARLEQRLAEPTLWDTFLRFLRRDGYPVPTEVLERDVTLRVEPSEDVQDVLLQVYGQAPVLAQLCERLVDLDEGLQEWRYRHVKMVERTIGAKRGTGGTSGAGYLRTTLSHPIFPDLWEIRSRL